MIKILLVAAIGAFIIFGINPATAAVPQLISYQGQVTDSAGEPLADSTYSVTFSVYDTDSGGTALWSSGTQSISTINGVYGYLLGSNVPFPVDLFTGSSGRWLGVQIDSDTEISPRTQLVSVPYALEADFAVSADSLPAGAVGSAAIIDSSIQQQDINSENWIEPTLLNGWSNYGPPYDSVAYFKDINGVVHFRGAVKTSGDYTLSVFQLPVGYRPEYNQLLFGVYEPDPTFVGDYVWLPIRIDVLPDGSVKFQRLDGYEAEPYPVCLDGATFRALD